MYSLGLGVDRIVIGCRDDVNLESGHFSQASIPLTIIFSPNVGLAVERHMSVGLIFKYG